MRNRLVNFYACYKTAPEQLDSLIRNGDHQGLMRMAHTLKSASGYIGALRLQLAALQLSMRESAIEQLAITLRQELQAVLAAILPHSSTLLSNRALENIPSDLAVTLERLETLIQAGDARASAQLSELEHNIGGSIAADLAVIREAFEDLDITLALSKLAALRDAHTANNATSL